MTQQPSPQSAMATKCPDFDGEPESPRGSETEATKAPNPISNTLPMNCRTEGSRGDVAYHKRLTYNPGVVVSSGQIVTVCDSDAFTRPPLVRSIIETFEIGNIYDKGMAGKRFLNHDVLSPEALEGYKGKVVIASLVGIIEKAVELEELGIAQEDIVRLQ